MGNMSHRDRILQLSHVLPRHHAHKDWWEINPASTPNEQKVTCMVHSVSVDCYVAGSVAW